MGFLSGFSCCFQSSSGDRGTRILEEQPSSIISELCRQFSLSEMQSATNNFHNSLKVGKGSFGNVYKGYLENSSTPVAIKRCWEDSVVGTELVLVYDYMSNGSIRDHLHRGNIDPLPWKRRLQICIGVARALHYLHTGAKYTIIHRNIKTRLILLDSNWEPKVSSLLISKRRALSTSKSLTRVESDVKGTLGYLDPEYYNTSMLTEKSDVFSFCIVLLEVVSAKPAHEINREYFQGFNKSLRSSANEIVDPILKSKIDPDCWKTFVDITKRCLLMEGRERPDMGEVEVELERARKLQEEADAKN
ncbi:Receptor-like protein kinase FERONIA [Arachis hypogaea]|nr:Receptor-like protein kinase FERONIA [Arachis hypogaea]